MSFRLLANRLIKHGRFFWHSSFKREIYTNILENGKNRRLTASLSKAGTSSSAQTTANALKTSPNSVFRFQQHARKLFIDNVLKRCTTEYSAELRTQARKKLFYGDSAPFFALIGVSLASGAGVLTKEDELEGVCWEIREAATKLQNSWNTEDVSKLLLQDGNFDIDRLDVGPPIAKGCDAVVYAAALKNHNSTTIENKNVEPLKVPENIEDEFMMNLEPIEEGLHTQQHQRSIEMMSPIQNISRFVHNFGGSVDNLHSQNQGISFAQFDNSHHRQRLDSSSSLQSDYELINSSNQTKRNDNSENEDFEVLKINSSVEELLEDASKPTENICRYPFALKMMFNYDIQSNAMAILRAMYKETLPARQRLINRSAGNWERSIQEQTATLPPHPNIVLMFGYFCGEVKNFRDGHILYPLAQPQRINPQGYGRNMSLYLLMKRYDHSLHSYLNNTTDIKIRTRILLFAQLLEAIAHLNRHGIAHRDLKSDNILIELNDDDSPPILVLSDFGCCLADKVHGLQIPYTTDYVDKGGNAALMAPEIINKTSGTFSILNYSKSDLWAAGAIAYEIFGLSNPFYHSSSGNNKKLSNINYNENDLPGLGNDLPLIIRELILNILNSNPNKRLSPDVAANVMQLFLWAPSLWLKKGEMPSSPEILQWLLSLATKVMTESNSKELNLKMDELNFKMGRRTYTEYILICSFLTRARLRRIRGALSWIQTIV